MSGMAPKEAAYVYFARLIENIGLNSDRSHSMNIISENISGKTMFLTRIKVNTYSTPDKKLQTANYLQLY